MKIVIEIPDWIYEKFGYEYSEKCLISKSTNDIILDAFCNGTPLPKGHGRLIDADELKKHKYHDYDRFENAVSVAHIDWADTIIEADKEG